MIVTGPEFDERAEAAARGYAPDDVEAQDDFMAGWTAHAIMRIRADGIDFTRDEPIILGDDGRVWDVRHRIVGAIHLPALPVTIIGGRS